VPMYVFGFAPSISLGFPRRCIVNIVTLAHTQWDVLITSLRTVIPRRMSPH